MQVVLDQRQVVIHHSKCAVAQDALQGEDVFAVAQVFNGEGGPEAVRVGVFHAGPLAYSLDDPVQFARRWANSSS